MTTRLALELLAAESMTEQRVLDVGTGSGVLALAAAGLGAAHVLAVDIDDEARQVTVRNVDRNRADAVVTVSDRVVGGFDVVVANITVPTLIELAADLRAALRPPRGRLILSGILRVQEAELIAAFDGLQWIDRRAEGEWIAVAARLSRLEAGAGRDRVGHAGRERGVAGRGVVEEVGLEPIGMVHDLVTPVDESSVRVFGDAVDDDLVHHRCPLGEPVEPRVLVE